MFAPEEISARLGFSSQGMSGLQTSYFPYYRKVDNVSAFACYRLVMRCSLYVQVDTESSKQNGTVSIGVACHMFRNEHTSLQDHRLQTWWMLQALTELALDYENDRANVPVHIMYDDKKAYLCG